MPQRLLCCDSLLRIKLEELLQQICSLMTCTRKKLHGTKMGWMSSRVEMIRINLPTSGVFFGFGGGRDSSIVTANGDCTATMSSFAGFPVTCSESGNFRNTLVRPDTNLCTTSIIRSSWFMVEVPGKMGFLETNISCEMRWLNYATPSKKLSQDATTWPCVNSKCVPRRTEKNLWRSIPVNQAIRH